MSFKLTDSNSQLQSGRVLRSAQPITSIIRHAFVTVNLSAVRPGFSSCTSGVSTVAELRKRGRGGWALPPAVGPGQPAHGLSADQCLDS